jgi:hypothetical protein
VRSGAASRVDDNDIKSAFPRFRNDLDSLHSFQLSSIRSERIARLEECFAWDRSVL